MSSFILHIIFCFTLICINPCFSYANPIVSPNSPVKNPPKNVQDASENRIQIGSKSAEIAFKLAYQYSKKTLSFINGQLEQSPNDSQYQECKKMYEKIVSFMEWTVTKLPVYKDPIILITWPADSLIQLYYCQKGFKGVSRHPMLDKNARMHGLLELAIDEAHCNICGK